MRTMTTEEWKADELPNGGVELTKKLRGAVRFINGEVDRNGGKAFDGERLVIAKEDRCALAHLLAGNDTQS